MSWRNERARFKGISALNEDRCGGRRPFVLPEWQCRRCHFGFHARLAPRGGKLTLVASCAHRCHVSESVGYMLFASTALNEIYQRRQASRGVPHGFRT